MSLERNTLMGFVLASLQNVSEKPIATVNEDTKLSDMVDSLELVEVFMDLEESLGIQIADEHMAKVNTVKDVLNTLEELLGHNKAGNLLREADKVHEERPDHNVLVAQGWVPLRTYCRYCLKPSKAGGVGH